MVNRMLVRGRPGSMATLGISHVGLSVGDLNTSIEFYRNFLGLYNKARKQGIARLPSGSDKLVLHEKSLETRGFHFGFQVGSSSKVDEWKAWLRARNVEVYDDMTENKYRSFKIKDPDGYLIEIFCDKRGIAH